MPVLLRKARRDLWHAKGPFLGLVLMVVLGVAGLTSISGAYSNLQDAMDDVYEGQALHDVLIEFQARPTASLARLGDVEGVMDLEARLAVEAPMTFPDGGPPVMARLVGIPPDPGIDVLDVRQGRPAVPGRSEAVVESAFAGHHGVDVGDRVTVRFGNATASVQVVGIAISPEYLWPAKNVVEHMPDVLRRWGVFFLPQGDLERALGTPETVNQVVVLTERGASVADVLQRLTQALGEGSVVRMETAQNQASHVVLDLLTGALGQLAYVLPLVFLAVVALSTYVVMARLVHLQRANIGLLRALGYSPGTLFRHYMVHALLVAIAGSLVGFAVGYALSIYVTWVFASIASLQDVTVRVHWLLLAVGSAMSLAFTLAAALVPARAAARQDPAQAMRPPTPPTGRHTRIERILPRQTPDAILLGVRSVARNPRRALLTVLGLALATAILLAPLTLIGSLNGAVDASISRVQHNDATLMLQHPVDRADIGRLADLPGVERAEGSILLATSILDDGLPIDLTIVGLEPGQRLFQLTTGHGVRLEASDHGILLGRVLEGRGLHPGQTLRLYDEEVPILGFVNGIGATGYVGLGLAERWAGIPGQVTQAFIETAPGVSEVDLRSQLGSAVPVASFQSTDDTARDAKAMLRIYYGFVALVEGFALLIALAILNNTLSMYGLEESRDHATWRTLGAGPPQIIGLLTTQAVLLVVPGLLVGLAFGYLLSRYLIVLFTSDLFALDLVLDWGTWALVLAGTLAFGLLTVLPSARRALRMDLARVVRERAR